MTAQATETCPKCGGAGSFSFPRDPFHRIRCDRCGGSCRIPVPLRGCLTDDTDDEVEALKRKVEACRRYIEAEERLAGFDCPHYAEQRCGCGAAERRLFEATIELRRAALEQLSK